MLHVKASEQVKKKCLDELPSRGAQIVALERSHKSLMGSTSEEEPLTHGSKLLLSSCLKKKELEFIQAAGCLV